MSVHMRFDAEDALTLYLGGTLDTSCIADLDRGLETARRLQKPVTFDLARVRLIDRPTLQYLVDVIVIAGEVRVANCPEHVARWMRREWDLVHHP